MKFFREYKCYLSVIFKVFVKKTANKFLREGCCLICTNAHRSIIIFLGLSVLHARLKLFVFYDVRAYWNSHNFDHACCVMNRHARCIG